MLEDRRGLLQYAPKDVPLQDQPGGEVQSPQDEIPAGPVPEARAEPDDQEVPDGPGGAAPVASQGDIQIVPEPGGQGHVPPPPEGAHGVGAVGVVKVLVEPEAEDPPQADGHVGVAGEIEVDLEAIGGEAQPAPQHRQRPGPLSGEAVLPQGADGVGQQHLLGKSHAEPPGPQSEVLRRVEPVPQVRCHRFVLDDGAGDQLGEHGDEGAEVHHVALDRCVLPVHVDGIAHGLEGIERDADGQRDAQLGQINARDQGQIGCDEVPVLEKAQQSQVEDHRLGHEPPGLFVVAAELLHQQTVGVVDDDGEEHDDNVHRFSPAVEEQAHHQQHEVPPPQRREKVHQQRQRQVEK